MKLPQVRFGKKPASDIPWRKRPFDGRDDDSLPKKLPKSLVKMLGWDPTRRNVKSGK